MLISNSSFDSQPYHYRSMIDEKDEEGSDFEEIANASTLDMSESDRDMNDVATPIDSPDMRYMSIGRERTMSNLTAFMSTVDENIDDEENINKTNGEV